MERMQERIEEFISSKIVDMKTNVGGSLSESRLLTSSDNKKYFLKIDDERTGTLPAEADGLQFLAKNSPFIIPTIIAAEDDLLITEYIESGTPTENFFRDFGEKLAILHQVQGEHHGWHVNNFLGSSKQVNNRYQNESWAHFFIHSRLKPQITWLKQKNLWPQVLANLEENLLLFVFDILSEIKENSRSLLHGDLWSGNFLCDQNGQCVLIDPACYYGHSEAEISISRLFGGFDNEFFKAYYKELEPPPESEIRFKIYCLYHLLNHVNIFGEAYLVQTKQIIRDLLKTST